MPMPDRGLNKIDGPTEVNEKQTLCKRLEMYVAFNFEAWTTPYVSSNTGHINNIRSHEQDQIYPAHGSLNTVMCLMASLQRVLLHQAWSKTILFVKGVVAVGYIIH